MADLNYQYLDVLVKRSMNGDSNAFAEIYAVTYQRQYQFSYYFLKNIYKAQDTVKDLFEYALVHLDTLTDTTKLISWLDQMNYQLCYEALYGNPTSHESQLIWELPYRESAILLMYYYQNMDISEIMMATGEPRTSIRKYIQKGKRRLQRQGLTLQMQMLTSVPHLEKSEIDSKSADILLDTILENCNYQHHTIAVTTLLTDRIIKPEKYVLQKVIVALVLIGLLILPLQFVIPSTTVSTTTDANNGNPQYNITVSTFLRVRSVEAQLNGQMLPIYETAEKVYTIEPQNTGTAKIVVTLENGQSVTEEINIL